MDLTYRVCSLLPGSCLKEFLPCSWSGEVTVETQLHLNVLSFFIFYYYFKIFIVIQLHLSASECSYSPPKYSQDRRKNSPVWRVVFDLRWPLITAPSSPSSAPPCANQASQSPWITWVTCCSLGWAANHLRQDPRLLSVGVRHRRVLFNKHN